MRPERRERHRLLIAYLRLRRAHWLVAAMVLIGAVVAGWGQFEAPTPAAVDGGGTSVAFWRLFAVGSATVPVLALTSPLQSLETTAGTAFHRVRAIVLAAAFVLSCACVLAGAVIGVGATVVPVLLRALLAWMGLALVGGRVFGWSRCWILPWATMCGVLYWGHSGSGEGLRWWEFTGQPIEHLPSLLLSLGLFAAGLLAGVLTPWRIHRAGLRWRSALVGGAERPARSYLDQRQRQELRVDQDLS
ncbi:hypothetical protein OHA21_16495 [Actinoplanes sp. NBC_00393]|uniref:hypothetical protein n=1 Tax=Actinoplanes sp. NBC_00393 TaxID=2975953 RepID=UPI002E235BC8